MQTKQDILRAEIEKAAERVGGVVALANKAGINHAFVSQLKNGKKRRPSYDQLEQLSVAMGKDRYFLENLFYDRTRSDAQAWNNVSPAPPPDAKSRLIPVFDVSAGKFLFDGYADQYPLGESDEYESAVSADPGAVWLRVHGDSMIGDNINDGDLVLVEPGCEVQDGDIVVCNKNGDGVTIKQLKIERNEIRLRPSNSKYDDIIIPKEDAEDCRFFKIVLVKPKEWRP